MYFLSCVPVWQYFLAYDVIWNISHLNELLCAWTMCENVSSTRAVYVWWFQGLATSSQQYRGRYHCKAFNKLQIHCLRHSITPPCSSCIQPVLGVTIKAVLKLSVCILHRLSVPSGALFQHLLQRYWSHLVPHHPTSSPSITACHSSFT